MKSFLTPLLAVLLLLASGSIAGAEKFPSKALRLVVPNPPGGTVDVVARTVARYAGTLLGQSMIVENKAGADTLVGTELVARAPADGYTAVVISTPFALNPLTRQVPYDVRKDFSGVAGIGTFPLAIAVHPAVSAATLADLVALVKATPGGLNYASFGVGLLVAESFKNQAGIDLAYVPYQGGVQATMSVIGGHVPVLFAPVSDVSPHVASGKLRVIAVSSAQRSPSLPDVPTVAETGYAGFEWTAWIGIAVPAGTPRPVLEKFSAAVLQAVQLGETKAAFERLGIDSTPMAPHVFDRFIGTQMSKYESAIRDLNLKVGR